MIVLCVIFLLLHNSYGMRHMRIAAIESSPFLIPVRTPNGLVFHGYLMDMLVDLSTSLNFTYEIYLVKDSRFGTRNKQGVWSGLIGELVRNRAHFTLAPLSVTSERQQFVDFSIPFMETGVAIMYRRPKPGEKLPFTGLNDLITTDIQYGMLWGGATSQFFSNSKFRLYRELGETMKNRPGGISLNLQTAIEKVREQNFAFITESSVVDFVVEQPPCDLMRVGENVNTLGYGLGFPKGSELVELFNLKLLEMLEDGRLHQLKQKWWQSNCPSPQLCICAATPKHRSTTTAAQTQPTPIVEVVYPKRILLKPSKKVAKSNAADLSQMSSVLLLTLFNYVICLIIVE